MNTADLFEAVESGDLAEVQRILEHNPTIEVDALNEHENTPLFEALYNDQTAIIDLLLAHGAAVNGRVNASKTPLQMACYLRKTDIVPLLVEHGADVDAISAHDRRTPLIYACKNLDFARLLLNAGADVNGDDGEIAPLHEVTFYGNTEATELLIQSGADVNILSIREYVGVPAGSTPLHFAAHQNNQNCSNPLLAAGAHPNIANSEGQIPLHEAASSSRVDFVNALLDAGCDPLHRDNEGRTTLQYTSHQRIIDDDEPVFPSIITALVAAGDRSWECVPTPCPGLEAAMLSVWQNAPDELPELVRRLNDPPGTLVELYAHMDGDDAMKKVVQEVLRVLHRHFAGFPHLKEHLLNSIFGFDD